MPSFSSALVCAIAVHWWRGAIALAAAATPPQPQCTTEQNVILGFGNNLPGYGVVSSTDACCQKCRAFGPECKSWTYHPTSTKICYLHGAVTPSSPVHGAVSGVPHGYIPPPPPKNCIGEYLGCFKDFIPAPGVPAVRALNHLVAGPTADMSVSNCSLQCAVLGYSLAGVAVGTMATATSQPRSDMYSCYCDCSLNGAATALSNATCNSPCAGAPPGDGPCGADGAMATFRAQCTPVPPPSKTCGNGSKPLPPGPACSQAAAKQWKFCDTTASLTDRVNDLVNRITLEEAGPLLTARESPAIARLGIPAFYWGTNAIHGVQWGNATSFPQALNMGCTWNRTAMRSVGRTIGREMRALSNIGTGGVGLTSWSPTINLIRDPRWGRNQETVSEDPLLAGEYGAQFSLGMQYDRNNSDDSNAPTTPTSAEFMAVATLKHVMAYSLEQWSPDGNWTEDKFDRATFDSVLTPYDTEDMYKQPFKRAIEVGGAAGVMYACNMINGVPAVASIENANNLRSWGFTGYRTTDGDGIAGMNTPTRQNYTKTAEESIRVALTNGESDIDDGNTYADHMLSAVEAGLNESYIRRALFNTLRTRFRLGLFDPVEGQPWLKLGMADVDTEASRHLNEAASRQSMVLLQNQNNTLPFPIPTSGDVVVIGGSANSTRLLGGGHYARLLPVVDGFETGGFPGIPQAIEGLISAAHEHTHQLNTNDTTQGGTKEMVSVKYLPGIKCTPRSDSVCIDPQADAGLLSQAVEAAKNAAQVVMVINLQSRAACDTQQSYEQGGEFNACGYESEQHDRPSIGIPLHQESLAIAVLAATKAAGIPTVVVLVHGGGLAIESITSLAPAILDAHYPSETVGAAAIADALYGRFSPAGKLPYTVMPQTFINISNFASMNMTSPPGRTYKYYPTDATKYPKPVFPFGWGLTYSRFNFTLASSSSSSPTSSLSSTPSSSKLQLKQLGNITTTINVHNIGEMDSDEVVQVFFVPKFTRDGVPTPKRQLVDFERVHVATKGTVSIEFTITAQQLELVNADGTRSAYAGEYNLEFTNGVDTTVTIDFTLA
eukprot:m.147112 g.147112  ORF g.147112 m.147112 type:complete len:1059 (-) comp30518_c0_seq1:206-3382(-)